MKIATLLLLSASFRVALADIEQRLDRDGEKLCLSGCMSEVPSLQLCSCATGCEASTTCQQLWNIADDVMKTTHGKGNAACIAIRRYSFDAGLLSLVSADSVDDACMQGMSISEDG